MGAVMLAAVSEQPIDAAELEQLVVTSADGAIACFIGRVRDHDPETPGTVVQLDYSAHPDAPHLIEEIVARAQKDADPQGLTKVAAAHRVGALGVGEVALAVVVASAHRAPAFAVCQAVVEAIKHELPVWKRQLGADGSHAWSGLTEAL